MNLDTSNWKPFLLNKLYIICMGNGFDKNKMIFDNPEINFVSRVSYNNGVDCKVEKVEYVKPYKAGLLTVALGGSYLGSCFIQEDPFYTAQNVAILEPRKKEMTHSVNLFISSLIRHESKIKYYAFGRELNSHINTDFNIKLPIKYDEDGTPFIDESNEFSEKGLVPDWEFMDKYINSLHHKPLTTKNANPYSLKSTIYEWKPFKVGSLFELHNGQGITQDEIAENAGDFNAVQSGEDNNGVIGKIDLEYCKKMGYKYTKKPCLTVARTGSAGFVSYQKYGCVVGDSAKILLLPDEIATTENYLFLQTVLMANKFKYDYGRKVTEENYLKEIIALPIKHNDDGSLYIDEEKTYSDEGYVPDWAFIKKYIRSLPYGDRLEG